MLLSTVSPDHLLHQHAAECKNERIRQYKNNEVMDWSKLASFSLTGLEFHSTMLAALRSITHVNHEAVLVYWGIQTIPEIMKLEQRNSESADSSKADRVRISGVHIPSSDPSIS